MASGKCRNETNQVTLDQKRRDVEDNRRKMQTDQANLCAEKRSKMLYIYSSTPKVIDCKWSSNWVWIFVHHYMQSITCRLVLHVCD